MTNRSLILLWAMAVGLLMLTLNVRSSFKSHYVVESKLQEGSKLLSQIEIEQIAKIKVRRGGVRYELVRDGLKWVAENLGGFPVQASLIVREIGGLSDSEVTQPMKTSGKYFERFGLDSEGANLSEVEFVDTSGKTIETIFLGDAIKASVAAEVSGRWVRLDSDPSTIYSLTEQHQSLNQPVSYWLVEDFLKIENIASLQRSIEIENPRTLRSVENPPKLKSLEQVKMELNSKARWAWMVKRRGPKSAFQVQYLTETSETNSSAVRGIEQFLAKPKFSEVIGKISLDEWYDSGAQGVVYRAEVETFDGFRYQLRTTPARKGRQNKDFIFSFRVEFNPIGEVSAELMRKFEKEKSYSEYLYMVKKSAILPLLKNRLDLLKKVKAQ